MISYGVLRKCLRSIGPIIRINPYEVIINDAEFYNEVYVASNTRRTGIWPRYRKGIGFDGETIMVLTGFG